MAEDAFNKIKKTITKSVVAVNVKTSVYLDTSKLKIQISSIEKEIQEDYLTLGKSVYLLWKNDTRSFETLSDTLQMVQEKYSKIDSILLDIEELEKHERDVFGAKVVTVATNECNVFSCKVCTTQYTTQVKFCKKCGNKME